MSENRLKTGILEPKGVCKKLLDKLQNFSDLFLFDGIDLNNFIKDKHILFIRLKYFIGNI